MQLILKNLLPEAKEPIELYLTQKKIIDFKPKDFAKLNDWILGVCYFIGITTPPEPKEREIIMRFIRLNYPDFSQAELDLAFNLAYGDKLKVKADQLNHFNMFSGVFISKVLNAYKEYRNGFVMEFNKKNQALLLDQKNELSEHEIAERMWSALNDLYELWCEGKEWKDISGSCYDWFSKRGFITIEQELTEEQRNFMIDLARKSVKQDLELKRLKGKDVERNNYTLMIKAVEEGNDTPQVQIQFKRLLLIKFFDKLHSSNQSVKLLYKIYQQRSKN